MNMPPVKYDLVRCEGGWDQITPSLSLKAGVVRDCLNYEVSPTGGYARIGGYERMDGRTSPSAASYTAIQISSFVNTPTTGQTLTGFSSGATGIIVALGANYIILTKVTLTFTIGETVKVGGTTIGVIETLTASITAKQTAQYTNLAADQYRADIGAVPGSGPVRGVKTFNDIKYAFRDNAGGTAVDMYKSSAGGWVQVPFEYEVGFSNANTSVGDGDVLTQGGVTATIRRVVVQTGTLASGTNTGRLIISVTAGGNYGAGAATSTGGGTLTLSAIQTAIVMLPGGKFEFDKANFFGQLSGMRLYGCDGVNRLFEFDGTIFVPISTGTTPDNPKHLVAYKNHLFCSIGSSVFNSGIGNAYNWTSTAGAAEQPVGDTVTGFMVQPGSQLTGTLSVLGRSNTFMLYGSSSANWNMVSFGNGVGALDYTARQMAQSFFLDDRGLTTLQTSQVYGNFEQSTLTNNINTFIKNNRSSVAYSSLSRERSQYRLFFSNGYGLYATIVNGKFFGAMQVRFPNAVFCASEDALSNGDEILLVGSASGGYVYQLDKGSSFDGEDINTVLAFNWNTCGSPRVLKRWRKGSIEIQGSAYAEIQFGYSLGYGSTEEIQPLSATYSSNSASSNWDTPGITWEQFQWDGRTLSPTEVEMAGTSENVQITISSGSDYLYPYTINSIIQHYSTRRGIR